MLSIPFILSIWTVLITCSEPKPHLRHKLPYNLPSGCCRYPGSPSFPRGRERMKSLQTERLSAYGRAYPSYRKKPVRQPCCPDARYGLYRHLKLLRSRACLPIRVLSCTYRLRGVHLYKGCLCKGAVEELGAIASQNADGYLVIVILVGLVQLDDG